MHLRSRIVLELALLLAAVSAWSQGVPKIPLPVAYTIDARLDVNQKTLDATEVLRYRNLTGQSLDHIPFHLYLNAFQPDSTFMSEARHDNPEFEWKDKWFGSIEIKSITDSITQASGCKGDACASKVRFIHPDDENDKDRTVMEVLLPRPLPPGGDIEFQIKFHNKFPEVFARTGYKRDFFMGGQWFPKVGVWWKNAWNCHQFHETTEFFSDFGTYDVKLTLPQNYVVGASGVETGSTNNADGTKTVSFHGDTIHDFAWTASPHFREVIGQFRGSAGPVKLRLLMQDSHIDQASRHMYVLQQTMQRFDQWYGAYPYPQITLVDPPHGALRAGGMEYPMLFTADTTWWMPEGIRLPEVTTEHEFGHQYWYGMVATNEFEDAWLDEGINSYTEVKVLNSIYGADTSILKYAGLSMGEAGYQRMSYNMQPDTDPLVRPGWLFMNRSAYGNVTYGKTATVLLSLEKIIGEDTLQHALRTYFQRYRFTHPTREDFIKTVEEVSGQDLRWFFDQAVYGTNQLDYEILSIESDRPDWAHTKASARQEKTGDLYYTSTVLVHRKGDFIFPVDVLIKFDSGDAVREHWDGRDRWVRYTYHEKGRVASAEIDPTHEVWLDNDFYNNSRTMTENHAATHKLANYWVFLTQWFAQLVAWLV